MPLLLVIFCLASVHKSDITFEQYSLKLLLAIEIWWESLVKKKLLKGVNHQVPTKQYEKNDC